MPRNQSKLSSAETALRMAPCGLRYVPRATMCPCSEQLVAALRCFPCPWGILGKVSCPFPGCSSPIPARGAAAQSAGRPRWYKMGFVLAALKWAQA